MKTQNHQIEFKAFLTHSLCGFKEDVMLHELVWRLDYFLYFKVKAQGQNVAKCGSVV